MKAYSIVTTLLTVRLFYLRSLGLYSHQALAVVLRVAASLLDHQPTLRTRRPSRSSPT